MLRLGARITIVVATLAAMVLALGAIQALAQTFITTTTGNIPRMTAKQAIDRVCLTRTFPGEDRVAEMPDMSLTFTQGGNTPEPVVVTFVGAWPKPRADELPPGSAPAGATIILEIDGARADLTSRFGGVLVHEGTATSVSNGTHGFTFVTEHGVAPGKHTAKILWLNNFLTGTGTICVFDRTLVVQHR